MADRCEKRWMRKILTIFCDSNGPQITIKWQSLIKERVPINIMSSCKSIMMSYNIDLLTCTNASVYCFNYSCMKTLYSAVLSIKKSRIVFYRFSSNPDNVRIIWNCLHEPQIISKPQICLKLFITILWGHISGLCMQDKQANCVDMRLIYDNNVRLI